MEPDYLLITRRMDKEIVNQYTMEFHSVIKKNEIKTFVGKWMEVEIVVLSKVKDSERYIWFFFPNVGILDFSLHFCAHDCVWVGELMDIGNKARQRTRPWEEKNVLQGRGNITRVS